MSDWEDDCMKWQGQILVGMFAHWCFDWDGLPIDETCDEWPCHCFTASERAAGRPTVERAEQ